MARIELRDCTIRFKDGLAGTGKLTSSPPSQDATSMAIDTVVLNTLDTDQIPVGAVLPWRRKPAHRHTSS